MASTAPGIRSVTLRLPFAARCVASARRAMVADLTAAGVPRRLVDDAVLVVSELLGNAVRHARPLPDPARMEVSWAVTDVATVRVEVTDGGALTFPQAARPGLGATGGRGLAIVEELADSWGVTEHGDGCTVWALLRAGEPRSLA